MKRTVLFPIISLAVLLLFAGCDSQDGPDLSGEMLLSSHLHGSDQDFYLYGYHYKDGKSYRYPSTGDPDPDILNEGFQVIGPSGKTSVPGFNAPGDLNGFALVGEFSTASEARSFYESYTEVAKELSYKNPSDTVRLNQVWVQLSSDGNYVKLLVKEIQVKEPETGKIYNELSLDYTYQPDGSAIFE